MSRNRIGSAHEIKSQTVLTSIADRYRVKKKIGQGGMAAIYQVLDETTGKILALKHFVGKGNVTMQASMKDLFEYEYHTLAQMAHPRIIEVYDFGIHNGSPYYTMELLDGGDLRALAPLPWKRACSLMIDVCSALGLVHSRRRIHRDLSPRNVHFTRDGKAKLIDFGAMIPMGPNKQVVGTPTYVAPEVVTLQTVDARTDLYSLGATFYRVLTGRDAFPCKSFSALRERWRCDPELPSTFVADIPKELDDLVMSLIALDPISRPINTAEVIEKLSAIADLQIDDQLVVSQAYLATPLLKGRSAALSRVRARLKRARRGHGGTILIQGASGVGRSRFLDACVLRGKLSTVTILRADATDSRVGSWGVVKAIAAQLLDALPQVSLAALKPHISILELIMPELLSKAEDKAVQFTPDQSELRAPLKNESAKASVSSQVRARGKSHRSPRLDTPQSVPEKVAPDARELRPLVHAALQQWLLEVSREHCLMIAIDDIHRIDEPSAAFVALLSREISGSMLLLAVTIEIDARQTSEIATKILKEHSHHIKLANLSSGHTERLLGSVFGLVPNLRLVSDRLQTISHGNPRAVMQLAQHLVDKGLIYYRSGAWTLPSSVDMGDLPGSMSEALEARLSKLSIRPLMLARTFALSPEQRYRFDECRLLAPYRDIARLIQDLGDLVALEILETDGEYYALSQQSWVAPLLDKASDTERSNLHLRLADVLHKRGNQDFRVAQHLLRAGQEERALDAWVDFARQSKEITDKNPQAFAELVGSLPGDWYESYDAAIRLARKKGRPQKQIYTLMSRVLGMIAFMGIGGTDYFTEIFDQLARHSGLSIYHELGDSVPAEERLGRALQLAKERYDSTPESERVLDPLEAIRELARVVTNADGLLASSYDFRFWQTFPSLDPLKHLSPALGVVALLHEAIGYRITNREAEALRKYREILERLAQPDRGGLDETYYAVTLYGIKRGAGMLEAGLGLDSALKSASEIEVDPAHRINAWYIRASYNLWQGDGRKAEECKQRIELLQTQNSPTQWYEGSHLARWAVAYALADDLWGVKQTLVGIEKIAKRFESWVATRDYVQGEYERIRGDYHRSLGVLQKALKQTAPGRHQNWADIAGATLRTLIALGRNEEARATGREFLEMAEREGVGLGCNYLKMPLAIAEAALGDFENATALSDAVIQSYRELGTTGLNLGLAYETRARVAVLMNEYDLFNDFASRCSEAYTTGNNAALSAKYEKLIRDVRRAQNRIVDEQENATEWSQIGTVNTMIMDENAGPKERAKWALDLLIQQSNALGGFLYMMQREGPVLSAQSDDTPPTYSIEYNVRERFSAENRRHRRRNRKRRRKPGQLERYDGMDWVAER